MFKHYKLMAAGSLAIYWLTIGMIVLNTFQEAG